MSIFNVMKKPTAQVICLNILRTPVKAKLAMETTTKLRANREHASRNFSAVSRFMVALPRSFAMHSA